VRHLLFATEVPGASLGPLEDSLVSRIPGLMEKGLLEGEGGKDFVEWAREVIASSGYEDGVRVLAELTALTAGPTEEISAQIHQAVLASRESEGLQLSDEQVKSYVDVLRRTLEAVIQAKMRAGIERSWPVARLAVRGTDPMVYDAVTAFRKIIVSQSGAKELDIVGPNDSWRGMKITIQVHMDSVSAAYRLWAKKIEILLRSQDSWKIKAGLEKGEYFVGIEGQRLRIDPSMVSFVESVPESVVEEPFDGGIVYLDTRMTRDLLAEGYANEVVGMIREARADLAIPDDRIVQVEIAGGDGLRDMLRPWVDRILREANALDVKFVSNAPADAYVIEAQLGDTRFFLAVREAEM
jgi:isoleucyl-tRNA synthetase